MREVAECGIQCGVHVCSKAQDLRLYSVQIVDAKKVAGLFPDLMMTIDVSKISNYLNSGYVPVCG